MADISATAADILKASLTGIDGVEITSIRLRLVDALTDPPSYYLASGDVTVNGIESIVAGTGIDVDNTDPNNPIINATGAPGGIDSVVAGDGITVDATDPSNPIVSADSVTKGFSWNINATASGLNRFLPIGIGYHHNNGDAPTSYSVEAGTIAPFDGTLKNLIINTDDGTSDGTCTWTVYKNGIATALQVVIANGQTTGSDTSHGVSFVTGDGLSIFRTGSGSIGTWVSGVEVDVAAIAGDGNVQSVLGGTGITVNNTDPNNPVVSAQNTGHDSFPFFFAQPNGADNFYAVGVSSDSATSGDSPYTEFGASTPMPFAGTLTKLYLQGQSVGLTANEIMFVTIDGVNTAITAVITDADQTPSDLTHTAHFVAGAKISIFYDPTSAGNISGFSGTIGVIWD